MPQEDLSIVKEILDEALDLSPAKRRDFVAEVCAGDVSLRREVESLLEQEDAQQPWCEGPILSLFSRNGTFEGFQEDQRIGPYRIVRTLGEGGMGAVALAVRQDDFEKQVALKVIKPGRISEDLTRRFENERQILARLEHPNIARILDGGTTAGGHPYFVMEYVEGQPIDQYCDRREVSIRERLRLFLRTCSALQVAHQNLVVHRDLKPSNILVTEEGVPKLLDFGIAKQLEPEPGTELTHLDQRPMSLRYASPEQIEGRPITTGTDIYSLGVLLYQLLTGQHPFPSKVDDPLELALAIRDEEPRSPSSAASDPKLRKDLTGDLDSIVLKALRKEPDQRYGSVEQLAADIRRHMKGEVVLARTGSRAYRVGKLVKRNRLSLAAAAALVVFGLTTSMLLRQAVDERERAISEHERGQKVIEFMKGLFRAAGPETDPSGERCEAVTAHEILQCGELNIEEFEEPLLKAELLTTVGEVYVNLGLFDDARAPWDRAEYLLRQHYPEGHPALAVAINNLASWFYRTGDYERAEGLYQEALAMKLSLPPDDDIDIAKAQSNLATILMHRGDYEEAEALYRQSLELRRERYDGDHRAVVRSLRSLGVLYYTWGDLEQAEPFLRDTLEIRERIYAPSDTRIATALGSLGRLRHAQGRYEEAERMFTRALEIRSERLGEDHLHVAFCRSDLARLYLDTGELAKGKAVLTRSLDTLRRKRRAGSWEIADAESVLGGYLAAQGHYEEAEPYLAESYRALTTVRGERSVYARDARRRLLSLYDDTDKPEKLAALGADTK